MPICPALTSFSASTTISSSAVNSNFTNLRDTVNTYAVLTDVAKTVSVTHTFSASQTFSAGVAVTGNSTIVGTLSGLTGLTVASGGATVTAGGLTVTAGGLTVSAGTTAVQALTCTTLTPSGLAQAGQQSAQKRYNAGNSGASITLSWNNGNDQRLVLTANCTLTFSNPVVGAWYTVEYQQDGTGSRTVSYAAGTTVSWPDGTTPTLTTTANRKDVLVYKCVDATSGGTYLGSVYGQNFNNTTA